MDQSRRDFLATPAGIGSLVNPGQGQQFPDASGMAALAGQRVERKLEAETAALTKQKVELEERETDLEEMRNAEAEIVAAGRFPKVVAMATALNALTCSERGDPPGYLKGIWVQPKFEYSFAINDGQFTMRVCGSLYFPSDNYCPHRLTEHVEVFLGQPLAGLCQEYQAVKAQINKIMARLAEIKVLQKNLPAMRRRFRAFFAEFQLKQSAEGQKMLETLDGGAFIDNCVERFEAEQNGS